MRQLRRDDNGDARTGSDDVSRVQRALRGCDDSKDYEMKEIGEEGRGGYSEWSMVCQPHFTNWLTFVHFLLLFVITSATYVMPHPNSKIPNPDYLNS